MVFIAGGGFSIFILHRFFPYQPSYTLGTGGAVGATLVCKNNLTTNDCTISDQALVIAIQQKETQNISFVADNRLSVGGILHDTSRKQLHRTTRKSTQEDDASNLYALNEISLGSSHPFQVLPSMEEK